MELPFGTADILIPQGCDLSKWSVVACDQYSSQPEYWQRVETTVGQAPSALRLILPEAQLGQPDAQARIATINARMRTYLREGLFAEYKNSLIYLERTLPGGRVRRGLVGKIDLECYDYTPGSGAAIRATEGTVRERIPPRVRVRENAALELPHVMLLMDDPGDTVFAPIAGGRDAFRPVYDFELMENGGHVRGWQVCGQDAADALARMAALQAASPMLFAVGDGNHSLASAKTCYENLKAAHPGEDFSHHPARYALVEVENIHDAALEFEPIHRVVFDIAPEALLADLQKEACAPGGFAVTCCCGEREEVLTLDRSRGHLAVGALQSYLDGWLAKNGGKIDYIHGEDVARALAKKPGAVAFLLPPMDKAELFPSVIADGVLPRKTFSMGEANEKRFYLEARRIQDEA